jgi:hypothetical protein
MTAKVWTVNIQTVMVLPFESDRDLPPDEWPLRELLTRIIDQSTTGALDVDLTAIEWVLKCEPVSTQSTLPIVEQDDRSNVIEKRHFASCDRKHDDEEIPPEPIDLKATPNLDRPKRIRSSEFRHAVIEFHYRSEGYTRLARGLNIGTAEPANGSKNGVWLTLAERTLIRSAHEDRYPKKSPASEA